MGTSGSRQQTKMANSAPVAPARLLKVWGNVEDYVATRITAVLSCRSLHADAFRVLRSDSELLLIPILHTAMASIVLAAFGLSLAYAGTPAGALLSWTTWLRVLAFVLIYDVLKAVFRGAAMIAAVDLVRGGEPTVRDGFQALKANIWSILGWALLNGGPGRLANLLATFSEKYRLKFNARWGDDWQSARHFALPALVLERCPLKETPRRAQELRRAFAPDGGRVVIAEPVASTCLRLVGVLWAIAFLFAWSHGDWLLSLMTSAAAIVTLAAATGMASALYAILLTNLHAAAGGKPTPEAVDALRKHVLAAR